jgi:hypothetical protein
LVGAFDTEAAARAVAARALADGGPASVEPLALIYEDAQGELTTIAEGLALVRDEGEAVTWRTGGALSA